MKAAAGSRLGGTSFELRAYSSFTRNSPGTEMCRVFYFQL